MEESRDLIFCGDIHGDIKTLVHKLTIGLDMKNSNVVICGDYGVGFEKPGYCNLIYTKISPRLEKWGIVIYVVRGNHDNPSYFDGAHDYPRLKFVKDHEIFEASGKTIYPIGGGISIDQEWRKAVMSRDPKKVCWWEGEDVEKKLKDLPAKVDIIVSHDAPISFLPVSTRTSETSVEIWDKSLATRNYLETVKEEVNVKYWYYGHHHKSYSGSAGDIMYRGLDISELYLHQN